MKAANARTVGHLSLTVAAQIRAERASAGLTQDKIIAASGVSRSTYLRLESGKRPADITQIGGICDALNLDLVTFFERVKERMG
ncbi:helix-turn-helix transcriptional regulator [Knoellia sp. S7-12]|uniref:helix-turn-helix domain-containing protein n=1 Tax=Knoellia sp. S7-12 TaxID=3126698 RepID=UPI003366D4CB